MSKQLLALQIVRNYAEAVWKKYPTPVAPFAALDEALDEVDKLIIETATLEENSVLRVEAAVQILHNEGMEYAVPVPIKKKSPGFLCTYMDLSTGHLSKATVDILEDEGKIPGVIYDKHRDHGWWVAVPMDDDKNWPDDLRTVFDYARSFGALWLLFDADADEIDELEIHQW